ncbi:MAG: excinuclease ABC subunit B [Alteromonas naphthalenivorans]|jgi:excinuclease ABC subunit B
MALFKLKSPFKPKGSQPKAIKELLKDRPGKSTLMGVTGSGKTFTMANIIAQQDKPVLVLSPNKTLAAQLYEEFSLFFPENKVCYFVSYYDYYQPESYLPAQDIYIAKETKINTEIERLRVETTASLVNRKDTIVIASVSTIYALGNPTDYRELALALKVGDTFKRKDLLRQLIFIQYKRDDFEKGSGTFQVRGNTVEVNLPYIKDKLRIELFGDTIEGLQWVTRDNNRVLAKLEDILILPAKHFVTTEAKKRSAITSIKKELKEYLPTVKNELYRQRLAQRTARDLEMIDQVGYCSGIENYSSHFDGRKSGEQPFCLFDFFPKDFLCIIDESHIALPQMRGMYAGDRSRKRSLIDFGFRLPSALDNRPLQFEETEKFLKDAVFVSATPGPYELEHSSAIVEQVIRPTGLVDPIIEVVGRIGQMDHLVDQIKQKIDKNQRTLVTVLTKKLAEDLARYLEEKKLKVCYLHSDIKTPQRTELLQKLRMGVFDCLVGVNLLREGLDLPEVALVAIMDADIESFLRDKRSLIQTIGRAARNVDAKVIMYADKMTGSMKNAIDETDRRRIMQQEYNKKHGITPESVQREVTKSISKLQEDIKKASNAYKKGKRKASKEDLQKQLAQFEYQMHKAAEEMDFEKAIELREQWMELQKD